MFSVRTIIWVTLIVFLLPADEKGKQELYGKVHAATNFIGSACNQISACADFEPSWGLFAKKAQTGADVIAELIQPDGKEKFAQTSSVTSKPASYAQYSDEPQKNTLEISDLIPTWRCPDGQSYASR